MQPNIHAVYAAISVEADEQLVDLQLIATRHQIQPHLRGYFHVYEKLTFRSYDHRVDGLLCPVLARDTRSIVPLFTKLWPGWIISLEYRVKVTSGKMSLYDLEIHSGDTIWGSVAVHHVRAIEYLELWPSMASRPTCLARGCTAPSFQIILSDG